MPGISSTVLADRLSELEREGLVSKKIYPEIPPKVEYRLTFRAEELRVIFKKLGTWASRITTKTKSRALARSASESCEHYFMRPFTDPRHIHRHTH